MRKVYCRACCCLVLRNLTLCHPTHTYILRARQFPCLAMPVCALGNFHISFLTVCESKASIAPGSFLFRLSSKNGFGLLNSLKRIKKKQRGGDRDTWRRWLREREHVFCIYEPLSLNLGAGLNTGCTYVPMIPLYRGRGTGRSCYLATYQPSFRVNERSHLKGVRERVVKDILQLLLPFTCIYRCVHTAGTPHSHMHTSRHTHKAKASSIFPDTHLLSWYLLLALLN